MKTKILLGIFGLFAASAALGQESTIFTYQGRLNSSGAPANGAYDLKFSIYDSTNQPGVLIAGPLTNFTVSVSNGLFTTPIDVGVVPFNGSDRWLEIAVRTNGSGAFSTLAARQQITLAPYAIMARSALFAVSNFTVGAGLYLPPTNVAIYSGSGTVFWSDSFEENVFAGAGAGAGGQANTAVGKNALGLGSGGAGNTALGDAALSGLLSGFGNTAIGSTSMASYTNGNYNTALGAFTLGSLTAGSSNQFNTAEGWGALASLTSGNDNTANGWDSLLSTTTGTGNTANGVLSLFGNTTGGFNVAMGYQALYSNSGGSQNTAIGNGALYSNTGDFNTAVGNQAMYSKISGNEDIALGDEAGYFATGGNWNIHIGNFGLPGDDHTIKIGDQGTQTSTYIAGIAGTSISGGAQVYVNSSGQLGSASSAFVQTATVGNIQVRGTVINNSLCNGKSNAILIVTPVDGARDHIFVSYINSQWEIIYAGQNMQAGDKFNVFVANP
jgi:hypothetical protein